MMLFSSSLIYRTLHEMQSGEDVNYKGNSTVSEPKCFYMSTFSLKLITKAMLSHLNDIK